MTPEPSRGSLRVGLLFTRYPVATETFLQREVDVLQAGEGHFTILALWPVKGAGNPRQADETFRPWQLLSLLFWLPYWMIKRPRPLARIVIALLEARRPNAINFFESLLGMAYGICEAHRLSGRIDHFHAVWASAPATAAWVLSLLVDVPYSMAGHAYDLFENGGDGLLDVKIPGACFIRTSTDVARDRWIELGARPGQVLIIRRGLMDFPRFEERDPPVAPYRILAVGRLVEKMGFHFFLDVLAELARQGMAFRAILVGEGPERPLLQNRAEALGLSGHLEFTGALPYREVEQQYSNADLFLFTGKVARSGDRAGFPNAIGEAMAWGVPVCATPVGAVLEGIDDGKTGLIATSPGAAARQIVKLLEDPGRYLAIRSAARQWVETAFDAKQNMGRLQAVFSRAHRRTPSA